MTPVPVHSTLDRYKRDDTGALINLDDTQYQQIVQKRQQTKERQDLINRLKKIEDDIMTIKISLQTLLSRK